MPIPNYHIQEYAGPIDDEHNVEFTFAGLAINFADINDSISEQAKMFIKGVLAEVDSRKKKPIFAMSTVGFPGASIISKELLKEFLVTIVRETDLLSIPMVGGHTVESTDLIYILILVEIKPVIKALKKKKAATIKPTIISKEISANLLLADKIIINTALQGCAAKYPPQKLDELLKYAISGLSLPNFGNLQIKEDVILYHLDKNKYAAFTVDIIKPIVNSTTLFGHIAINHAASDLYAKGIFPQGAVAMIFTNSSLSSALVEKIQKAGQEEVLRLSADYLGVYRVAAKELFFGALLYGVCSKEKYISNYDVKAGDLLILTKPIGSGVVANYAKLKAFVLSAEEAASYRQMIENMLRPNDEVVKVMKEIGANACTDITGFSLIGHLQEMLAPAKLGARLWLKRIPFLPHAADYFQKATHCSVNRNMHYFSEGVLVADSLNNSANAGAIALLYDAQTAGGFLISAPVDKAKIIINMLGQRKVEAAIIGEIIERERFVIEIQSEP